MALMRAAVFVEPGRVVLDEKSIPDIGPLDALIRITTTTICGTDVHILKGEYPVAKGLTIGHEPVGVIEKLGSAVSGFHEGERVIAGAITPSGYSNACLALISSNRAMRGHSSFSESALRGVSVVLRSACSSSFLLATYSRPVTISDLASCSSRKSMAARRSCTLYSAFSFLSRSQDPSCC